MSYPDIPGLHHVTIITGDPNTNIDFFNRILGLRLVKKTINFDDHFTYHLYYGDKIGSPGSIITFFPWPDSRPGQNGTGQAKATAFMIPENSVEFWQERLKSQNVELQPVTERYGEQVLQFRDPDGVYLELVASSLADQLSNTSQWWNTGDIPAEHAIRGFHSVTLNLESIDATKELLLLMGFSFIGKQGNRYRFQGVETEPGSIIDLAETSFQPGSMGKGIVHHVAFRCADDREQAYWQKTISGAGLPVTEVRDRQYFKSVYFQEPGGVLFEIATDIPGFTIDEPVENLGNDLKLPEWLEPRRNEIEPHLPKLDCNLVTK